MNDFVNTGLSLPQAPEANPSRSFTASKEDVQAYEAHKIAEAIAVHDRAHQRPAKLFGSDEGPSPFQRQNEVATAAAIAAHDRVQAQRAADKAHKAEMDAMLKRDRPGYSISDGDNGEVGALDGKSRGSLLDDVKLGGAALDIQKAAERVYNQRNELANSGEQAGLAKLAVSGDPNFLDGLERMKKDHPQWLSPEKAISLQNAYNHALMKKDAELAQQRAEQDEQNQKNELVRQDLPLIAQGKLQYTSPSTIIGADGKPKVISAEDRVKNAVAFAQRDIDNRYAGQNSPQAQAAKLNEEAQLYADNGVVNDAWKRQLGGGTSAASTIVAAGGQVPQGLSQAYDLYKNLSAKAPQALGKHLSDEDQDFYEVAKVLEQSGNYDAKQALTAAAVATSDPQWKQTRNTLSLTRTEEREKAMASLHQHWFTDNPAKTVNADQPLGEVLKFAGALNRAFKIPIDQAIQKAGDAVASKYAVINNTAVRLGDKRVPPNFAELANAYIDHWAEEHKADLERAHVDKDDITMVNINNTPNWQIMFRGDPGGVTLPGANFSLRELYDQQQRIDEKAATDRKALGEAKFNHALKDAQAAQKARKAKSDDEAAHPWLPGAD